MLSILWRKDLACGETYMADAWRLEKGDLGRFLAFLLESEQRILAHPLAGVWQRLRKRLPLPRYRNDSGQSRRNVAHHYDIGNDLYRCFLDPGMNYSCAFFDGTTRSLAEAQQRKVQTTIARLDVGPGMHVLDIGCGWGCLTRSLSARTGAGKIVGITLAENQYETCVERLPSGQGNRLFYRLQDYRDHAAANPGSYDRIVSVGMFEHVGRRQFETYFAAIREMLSVNGKALIHSIVKPTAEPTSKWIEKYIFPGGYIPTADEMRSAATTAGLELAAPPFRHYGGNYAETLRRWRRRFERTAPDLNPVRYNGRFKRMWEFYLAGSEATFDVSGFEVTQMLFTTLGGSTASSPQ